MILATPRDRSPCHPIDFGSCAAGTCEFARGDVHRLHSVWSRGGKGRRNPHMQAADRRAMRELTHDKQSNFSRVPMPRLPLPPPTASSATHRLSGRIQRLLFEEPRRELCAAPLCRVGGASLRMSDGGWPICLERVRRRCNVVSVGINVDPSFDVALGAGLGCRVDMYDPTLPAALQEAYTGGLHRNLRFQPVGLGATPAARPMRLTTLDAMVAEVTQGDPDGVVDVLKIDCEGCEWEVFEALLAAKSSVLKKVDQLLLEVHMIDDCRSLVGWCALPPGKFSIGRLEAFVEYVCEVHSFEVAWRHLNPNVLWSNASFDHMLPPEVERGGTRLWAFWEVLFIRG